MIAPAGPVVDYVAIALERAANLLDPQPDPYWSAPSLWVADNIEFGKDEGPTFYQNEAMDELVEFGREAVRGPHGLGKTALAAWIVLWYADTRNRAGVDWKVVTTASVWRQLDKYLWPEIKKWNRKLKRPFSAREMFELSLKLATGEAFAVASDNPANIEGAHADFILYLIDEAKAVPAETWEAIEGAFSGAGPDTPREALALAISTPGEPSGTFYSIHARKPGKEDWNAKHVTLEDAIKAGRISRVWAEQRKREWGETSSVYMNRVLGEFAAADVDGVIPSLAWVEAANERWVAIMEQVQREEDPLALPPPTSIGVDVARSGADKTVYARRHDRIILELLERKGQDTEKTADEVAAMLADGGTAVVDVIGIGAGVVDKLKRKGLRVQGLNVSERSDLVDRSGELGFANKRAAMWWTMRELLDPANGYEIALPPDDVLLGDLLSPRWKMMAGGRIQVEAKEDIKKRLGRSPDRGDAVCQAFFLEPDDDYEEGQIIVHEEQVQISPY